MDHSDARVLVLAALSGSTCWKEDTRVLIQATRDHK